MSRIYWIAIFALGLALFLGSASHGQADHPENDAEQANSGADQQIAAPILVPRIIEPRADQQARSEVQQDANDRQERDVRAQGSMERAAWRMEFWARWQTVFIGIGTLLVAATLYLMVRANQAATKAAEASEKSVQVTLTSYQAQLRAHLSFKFQKIENRTAEKPGRFVISIKNHGSTPAFVIRVRGFWEIFDAETEPHIKYKINISDTPTSKSMVFPGEELYMHLMASINSKHTQMVSNGSTIHVAGYVVYKDSFGVTRRTIFHSVCDQIKDGRITFHPFKRHNSAR